VIVPETMLVPTQLETVDAEQDIDVAEFCTVLEHALVVVHDIAVDCVLSPSMRKVVVQAVTALELQELDEEEEEENEGLPEDTGALVGPY
jgi:hypothetical protein